MYFFLEILWGKQEIELLGHHQFLIEAVNQYIFIQICHILDFSEMMLYINLTFFFLNRVETCHRFCLLGHHMSVLYLWDAVAQKYFFTGWWPPRMSEMFNFHIYNDEKPNTFTTFQDTLNNLQG